MKKITISLSDFTFKFEGKGAYTVTYTSPVTLKRWQKYITNMPLIDKTKNAEYPLIKHLNELKKICKS